MVQEKLIDLRGGKGFGRASVEFVLTEKGRQFARDALDRSTYIGPAPVPITQYAQVIGAQNAENPVIGKPELAAAISHLVVDPSLVDKLGPAVNSGRSLFLYGPPGNGKTTLAECVSTMLGGEAYIPHCVEIDNQVIKVFDTLVHIPMQLDLGADPATGRHKVFAMDNRWALCRRPSVVVGGELTLETLDLVYNDTSRYYEAPFQIKANGGMLLIDDFGRQKVHPTDLLNRWIVPLEKRIDFLTLRTGQKIEVPFDTLVLFSTNLDPKELVDEAFLRRVEVFTDAFTASAQGLFERYKLLLLERVVDVFYRPIERAYVWLLDGLMARRWLVRPTSTTASLPWPRRPPTCRAPARP